MENITNLKDLRMNMDKYAKKVAKGDSFIIFKRSKPLFKICPIINDKEKWEWEEVVDFTKIKKGGVDIDEVLSRL